jgi:predicted dehydrogenase
MITRPGGRELRVGVVGLGYWGPNLVRVLFELDDVDVAWICDLDERCLATVARRYPSARTTDDLDDVLEDETVDAVLIATPVHTHAALATRCLRAGKHTFVEKPLAPSLEEAEDLISLAEEVGRVLVCGHTFLYSPPVRAIRRLLEEGALGDLYFISSSRVNLGLHQRDVSVVWDLAPHDFSILLYWLGQAPTSVRAAGRASIVPGIPDVAFVTMTFADQLLANVELSWLAPSKLRRTVLVGSEAMVVYSDGSPEPVRIYDSGVVYQDPETFGEYQLSYRTGTITSPRIETSEPLAAELADFVESVRRGRPRERHTEIARDVVAMLAAADESLRLGGAEVELNNRVAAR